MVTLNYLLGCVEHCDLFDNITTAETYIYDIGHIQAPLNSIFMMMSGSLTRGVGENIPSIPGSCATRNFTYLARGPREWMRRYPSKRIQDSKVHGANMGPVWVLSAPDGPHVGPMSLAIRDTHCPTLVIIFVNMTGEWCQWVLMPRFRRQALSSPGIGCVG